MQAIFNLPNIQQKILQFDVRTMAKQMERVDQSKDMDAIEKRKMKKSVELISALQKMFAQMLLSK